MPPSLRCSMPTVKAESAAVKSSYRLIVAFALANFPVSLSRYTTFPTSGMRESDASSTSVSITADIFPPDISDLSLAYRYAVLSPSCPMGTLRVFASRLSPSLYCLS